MCDDLESFIYVIYMNALRFHRHDKSYIPGESRWHDRAGQSLAHLVDKYFFEHEDHNSPSGVFDVGGQYKHYYNSESLPPFILKDQETMFWTVIDHLPYFCLSHTLSLDTDMLRERYLPSVPRSDTPESGARFQARRQILKAYYLARKPEQDLLEDYDQMCTLFKNALASDEWGPGDKLPFDQFTVMPLPPVALRPFTIRFWC